MGARRAVDFNSVRMAGGPTSIYSGHKKDPLDNKRNRFITYLGTQEINK